MGSGYGEIGGILGGAAALTGTIGQMFQRRLKQTQTYNVPKAGQREQALNQGTDQLLEEARQLAENAVNQGQELSPLLYQYLGLQPQYEDMSGQLQQAEAAYNQANQAYNTAQSTISTLRAIPQAKRTPKQTKQLAQAQKSLAGLNKNLTTAKQQFGQLQTMPKRITGITRMDPNSIDPSSPFSAQNPQNQAVAKETQTLNAALNGEFPVDPTLARQYDQQEAALKARLAAQYGPDYANSSVGQLALSSFARTKADAFSTYNRSIIDQYQQLSLGGTGALQQIAGQQMGLWLTPSQVAAQQASNLSATATNRIPQEARYQQNRLAAIPGAQTTTAPYNFAPLTNLGLAGLTYGLLSQKQSPTDTTSPETAPAFSPTGGSPYTAGYEVNPNQMLGNALGTTASGTVA